MQAAVVSVLLERGFLSLWFEQRLPVHFQTDEKQVKQKNKGEKTFKRWHFGFCSGIHWTTGENVKDVVTKNATVNSIASAFHIWKI